MSKDVEVIYDGECPVCRAYVSLQDAPASHITRRDGRADRDLNGELLQSGLDLDEGIVVRIDGEAFLGAEALHRLALNAPPKTPWQRLNRTLFANRRLARFLYPPLRACRNLLLRLLGRSKINEAPNPLTEKPVTKETSSPAP